jgi:hypothetical protein
MQSNMANLAELDCQRWIGHFINNKKDRSEPDWAAPLNVPAKARAALTQSVVEFELGDGGGPASLIAFNRETFRSSSEEVRQIVDLWFAEEAEHSRLLGRCTERLGGTPIDTHWSFELFCALRKWLGVSIELQILTLTELVSTSYYTVLRRHCDDEALREAWRLILHDESGHVAFHNDRLAAMGRSRYGIRGRLWSIQFKTCGLAAASVLWSSHGRCMNLLGASAPEFFADVARQIDGFLDNLDEKAARLGAMSLVPGG